MNPYGRPPSSLLGGDASASQAKPSQQQAGNGNSTRSASTSPNVSTAQAKPSSVGASGAGAGAGASAGGMGQGNGLRPGYGLMTDRERERQREMANKPLSYGGGASIPRSANTSPVNTIANTSSSTSSAVGPHALQHHLQRHLQSGQSGTTSNSPAQTASKPTTESRPNPYAASSQAASSAAGNAASGTGGGAGTGTGANPVVRRAETYGMGLGGFGRLGGGYGLFGRSFLEAEARERDRVERLRKEREAQLERENQAKAAAAAAAANDPSRSPTNRTGQMNAANPYARPSAPTSPTAARSLPPPGPVAKPSVSPQPPAATASPASNAARPNLPLPGFGSLGSRSLPSPFDRDTRERSNSASVAPSPGAASHDAAGTGGHRRTPSNSSTTAPGPGGLGQTSPGKPPGTTQAAPASRSVFNGPPPLGATNRDRDTQSSASATAAALTARPPTSASPRDRESIVSPPGSAQSKPGTTNAAAPTTAQNPRPRSYSPYSNFGSSPLYPGSFGGFGLGGFGGYGAFGPRWDRERERERQLVAERDREAQRTAQLNQNQEAKELEARRAMLEREKEQAKLEKAREAREQREREQRWLYGSDWDRHGTTAQTDIQGRANGQPPTSFTAALAARAAGAVPQRSATTAPSAAAANAADPYRPRQTTTTYDKPEPRHIEVINHPETQPSAVDPAAGSVMQQVAPQREPRPYGYKAEPRDYQYTPRDKRPRMDAAVEDASAHASHRRSSAATKSKRRKEEDKKSPIVVVPKEKDWAALTTMSKRYPDVSSAPVEQWLKTVPDLDRIVSREVYTGDTFTLALTGCTTPENEGGIVIVRVGGGFLGSGWRIRGETGWDDSTPFPRGEVVCGAEDEQRRIWGTDVYTDDSDIGQVLVHAGWLRWLQPFDQLQLSPPPSDPGKMDTDIVEVTVRVVPRLVRYTATERNGVTSRGWGNGHDGGSIVVEKVERVKITKKYLASRRRKARIAEWASQRQLVAPLPPSELKHIPVDEGRLIGCDARLLNGVEDVPLVFNGHRGVDDVAAMKYSPDALVGWLDESDADDKSARTLWTHSLCLSNSDTTDRYIISLDEHTTPSEPRLKIVKESYDSTPLIKLKSKPEAAQDEAQGTGKGTRKSETIIQDRPISDIHFFPEGLAVRTSGLKGVLCPVNLFAWVERVEKLEAGFLKKDEHEDAAGPGVGDVPMGVSMAPGVGMSELVAAA